MARAIRGLTEASYPIVPLDPPISDKVPEASELAGYDREHLTTYLRLLDADAQGADWAEGARTVSHIDFAREPDGSDASGKAT